MKFYGIGIVWDKEKKRTLCSFVNGESEITDERTIAILQKLGYKYEKPKPKRGRKKRVD